MSTFKLPRIKQCKKCPWKVSTDPYDIPDGYDLEKHKALSCTIAKDAGFRSTRSMACHHSTGSDGMYCVGWLSNQLGPGNNIPLRIKMLSCENINQLILVGEQHQSFEDTLPTH